MDSLFDDALFSELKKLNAEELLIKCIEIIDCLDLKPLPQYRNDISSMKRDISLIKEKIKGQLQNLQVYLGEIYRRNIMSVFGMINSIDYFLEIKCLLCNDKKIEYIVLNQHNGSDLICSSCDSKCLTNYTTIANGFQGTCKSSTVNDKIYNYQSSKLLCDDDLTRKQREMYDSIKTYNSRTFKDKLQEIQMVKQTMLRIMKTPLLTKELEECMDEILDLNGNRISHLKEYLTEEQYRFVRSGAKFEELEAQQDMLDNLNKMLKQLKIYAVGQSIMDLPIARPITPEIKHLERELESHNFRQKKHEKDLEKLKCKI